MKDFLRKYGIWTLVVIALALFAYWFIENRSIKGVKQLDASQINELVNVIGEHIVLPKPLDVASVQVATVQDAEAVKKASQFFVEAKNGDQLVIFPTKVVLFRPSENRIVNMSAPSGVQESKEEIPNLVEETPKEDVAKVATKPLTVEIRNGSGKSGLATVFKTKLKDITQLQITKIGNASKDSYTTTIIVNKENYATPELSNAITGTVQKNIPEGESESTADILIILGRDAQ